MPDYQNGKIYTIRSYKTDYIYIGATTKKYLCDRISEHKSAYKQFLNGKKIYYSSFKILELEDAYIELLENYPCNSKDELCKKEGEYIRNTDKCVNKQITGRTKKEWGKDNIEKLREQRNRWYKDNRDKTLERQKKRYEDNKDKIEKHSKQPYICITCNTTMRKGSKYKHEKTKKHINNLE